MKHMLIFLLVSIILVIGGCSSESSKATEDMEVVKENVTTKAKGDEQEKTKPPHKYQVQLGENTFTIDLKKHSILNNFVSTSKDPQAKLETMKFIPVTMNEHADKALIEFACYENRCSYILIDFSKETSILLADLAKLEQVQVSHDNQMAIKFGRTNQDGVTTHHVEVVDLSNLEEKTLTIDDENFPEATYQAYQFPIENMGWTSTSELTIDIPRVEDYASYNLENWKAKGAPATTITLTIN
ncbi:hypothetical protein GCM10007216_07340 [Thalassobacillus devorans]|uniref:Lipoprotein n=1 Tax=Thalassobacillus devorans TaxID=279813 RepID=A0ABQ1NKE2_9BACI|nr:hypothetical protein [Thalassobacillus devorans]NIK27645.1 uncharacterized protein YceK [Thalassobacillus devorans]GGC79399.1 hypothetical protein GCM10007216_07340 [Thalassobacillus devorans]